jgi:hypothetical protein
VHHIHLHLIFKGVDVALTKVITELVDLKLANFSSLSTYFGFPECAQIMRRLYDKAKTPLIGVLAG